MKVISIVAEMCRSGASPFTSSILSSAHIIAMTQVTALIDANNFYASCEQSLDPALIGRPVVVLMHSWWQVPARYSSSGLPLPAVSKKASSRALIVGG